MKLKMPIYNIYIEENIIKNLEKYLKTIYQQKNIFIITDDNVLLLYQSQINDQLKAFQVKWISIKPGEESKTVKTYQTVIDQLLNLGIKRKELIIALGGGVVGDLAGFVAATLFRGLPFVQIPTTLMAQVDSSIGGKVGVNLESGKNLIGSFYQPKMVLIDPVFLETLSPSEYNNGLSEIIKCGLIADKKLYEHFLINDKVGRVEIIRAIQVKRKLVLKDPFEQYERMLLNFGHTFGHAIEVKHNYQIKHGVAVAHGMLIALQIGIKQGKSANIYPEVKKILNRLNLVEDQPYGYQELIPYLTNDKKNLADGLRFIYVDEIGKSFISKLDLSKL